MGTRRKVITNEAKNNNNLNSKAGGPEKRKDTIEVDWAEIDRGKRIVDLKVNSSYALSDENCKVSTLDKIIMDPEHFLSPDLKSDGTNGNDRNGNPNGQDEYRSSFAAAAMGP